MLLISFLCIIGFGIFFTKANFESTPVLPEGYYPHPRDCRLFFYVTEGGGEIKMECGEGLAYDVYTKGCALIDSARNPAPPCNTE